MNHILFENEIQNFIKATNSKINLSTKHVKYLNNSLEWIIGKDGELHINEPIPYENFDGNPKDQSRHSFVMWIYNENSVDDNLAFEFKKDGVSKCSFLLNLNFEGWRCAWVEYDRDMTGTPAENMDNLTIKAPNTMEGKSLYFSEFILSTKLDGRHHTRSEQTPFVNVIADSLVNSHWMSLYAFNEEKKKRCNSIPEATEQEKLEANKVEQKFRNYLNKHPLPKSFETIKEEYESYRIKITIDENGKEIINGVSIDYINTLIILDGLDGLSLKEYKIKFESTYSKDYVMTLYNTALAYSRTANNAEKIELKTMFVNMFKHFYDQGFACGSNIGTVHHLGYDIKNYYPAIYLMKNVLEEANCMDKAQKSIEWFSGMGRIFYENLKADGINMDVLNTLSESMLISILTLNEDLRVYLLKQYTKWLTLACSHKNGLLGPFKNSGVGYHHANFYPAYTRDGLIGLAPVIYFLSGSIFRLPQKQYELVKNVVMGFRWFCNREYFLINVCSRHPRGDQKFSNEPFKWLALSGSPDNTQTIDKEVAAAYLRLTDDCNDDIYIQFKKLGIEVEKAPSGNWAINHAVLGLHRRNDWLVGVRGHNRYLWANETYVANNLYGRYITHGNVEIMNKPLKYDGINEIALNSAFQQKGWDWNCWPGTTVIQKPVDELKSEVNNVDIYSGFEEMLISDETYAGALDLKGQNGMFAMKLHEHNKYEGSHRARKSVFMFDNRIICLGSNIENENKKYNTITTLFQTAIIDTNNNTDYFNINENYFFNNGNGYIVSEGCKVTTTCGNQESRDQADSAITYGKFSKAIIEHGIAPQNAEYEYIIIIETTLEELKLIKAKQNSIYTVLQKDKYAHIVKDNATDTTGYALFENNEAVNKGYIISIDTPAIVMIKEEENKLILSLCDPDLRFYEGIEADQYDRNGIQKEVSLYSRKWIEEPSKVHTLNLTIKGLWNLDKENQNCRVVSKQNETTTLAFDTIEGAKIEVSLHK